MMMIKLGCGIAVVLTMAACGSAALPPVASPPSAEVQATPREVASADRPQMEVEGIVGMLSLVEVHRALDPRMLRFLRCFSQRSDDVEVLSGGIELAFRVARDGSVRSVYPAQSTIGDRETERCLMRVAGATRFPRPRGGEAEFTFPLDFDVASDIRPPHRWNERRVQQVVARNGAVVGETCRHGRTGSFRVTAYVGPGGGVLAAGASADNADLADSLDCVASAVTGWSMPNPGSYPAKVSFLID